jgi:hypothetical protein
MATGTEHVGSMSFTLTAGEKVASGDVILFPLRPADEANRQEEETAPPPPRILPINFVRCVAGTVLGTVGPYHDPTCDCMVTTEFQGVVEGDRITGRFTTWREESTVPVKGRWTMRRKGA